MDLAFCDITKGTDPQLGIVAFEPLTRVLLIYILIECIGCTFCTLYLPLQHQVTLLSVTDRLVRLSPDQFAVATFAL